MQRRRWSSLAEAVSSRLYLTWSSVPEIADLPKAQGKKAWRYAFPRALLHPSSLLLLIAGSFAVSEFSRWAVGSIEPRWLAVALGLALAGTFGLLYGSFLTHRARPKIASYLAHEQTKGEPAA